MDGRDLERAWEIAINKQNAYEADAAAQLTSLADKMNHQLVPGGPRVVWFYESLDEDATRQSKTPILTPGQRGRMHAFLRVVTTKDRVAGLPLTIHQDGSEWHLSIEGVTSSPIPLRNPVAAADRVIILLHDGLMKAFDDWKVGREALMGFGRA